MLSTLKMYGTKIIMLSPRKQYEKNFDVKSIKFFFVLLTEFSDDLIVFLSSLRTMQRKEKDKYFNRNSVSPAMINPTKALVIKEK